MRDTKVIKAKKDNNYSSPKYSHYVIGKVGDPEAGGLYLDKSIWKSSEIKITLEEATKDD